MEKLMLIRTLAGVYQEPLFLFLDPCFRDKMNIGLPLFLQQNNQSFHCKFKGKVSDELPNQAKSIR